MIRTSVSAPFCFSPLVSAKACHMAYRRVGVYIVLLAGICWARAHTGDVSPDRALYLPIFSHFLIVNKTSLSLSLSLSPEPPCGYTPARRAAWPNGEWG